MAVVTRLGLYGGPRGLYGDFSAKTEQEIVEVARKLGGSSKRRRRSSRYPRRISIDGELHWVRNAEEERALLAAYRARLEREAAALEAEDAPAPKVAAAKVRLVRAERRIEQVDDRRAAWMDKLRREDEEILLLFH